jgi:hypothetical protein
MGWVNCFFTFLEKFHGIFPNIGVNILLLIHFDTHLQHLVNFDSLIVNIAMIVLYSFVAYLKKRICTEVHLLLSFTSCFL